MSFDEHKSADVTSPLSASESDDSMPPLESNGHAEINHHSAVCVVVTVPVTPPGGPSTCLIHATDASEDIEAESCVTEEDNHDEEEFRAHIGPTQPVLARTRYGRVVRPPARLVLSMDDHDARFQTEYVQSYTIENDEDSDEDMASVAATDDGDDDNEDDDEIVAHDEDDDDNPWVGNDADYTEEDNEEEEESSDDESSDDESSNEETVEEESNGKKAAEDESSVPRPFPAAACLDTLNSLNGSDEMQLD